MKAFLLSIISIFSSFMLNAQWVTLPFNTGYQNYSISFANKDTGYVCNGIWQGPPPGINHTKLFKTTNGGSSWLTVVDDYTNTPISDMHYLTENLGIYRRWQDNVMKTTNGGITGIPILSGLGGAAGDKIQVLDSLTYFFSKSDIIHYTTNGGANWISKNVSSYLTSTNGDTYCQFSNLKNGFIWGNTYHNSPTLYTDFFIYRTIDSCQTLQLVHTSTTAGAYTPSTTKIKFINDTTALMLLNNSIYKTNDVGANWNVTYTFNAPERPYLIDIKDNMIIIVGSSGTTRISIDHGVTFQTGYIGSTLPNSICIADPKYGIAYGITQYNIIKLGNYVTSLNVIKEQGIDVYPNPTCDFVTLKMSNNAQKNIDAEILDDSGKNIGHLNVAPDEKMDIRHLANGYYIFKIRYNNEFYYKKFLKE